MRTGPIRRTDWLPVGDTTEGEQLERGYDSQSEGSSAEEEAMRADPGYDDDFFSRAIQKTIRTGARPNYVDSDDDDEEADSDEEVADSDEEDEGLLESYAAGRDSLLSDPSMGPSLALLLGQ